MKLSQSLPVLFLLASFALPVSAQAPVATGFSLQQIGDLKYRNREPIINRKGVVVWSGHGQGEMEDAGGSQIFIYKDGKTESPTTEHIHMYKNGNMRPVIKDNDVVWMTTRPLSDEWKRKGSWILQLPPNEVRFDPASPELPAWYAFADKLAIDGEANPRDFNLEPKKQIVGGPFSNVTDWSHAYVNANAAMVETNKDGKFLYEGTNALGIVDLPVKPRSGGEDGTNNIWAVGINSNSLRSASGLHEYVRLDLSNETNELEWLTHDYRNDVGMDFDGDLYAWQKAKAYPFGWEIMVLDGKQRMQLTTNYYYEMGARVNGRDVTWYGWDGNDYEIFHFNADTRRIQQITSNEYDDVSPQISNGHIVWEGYNSVNPDIWFWAGEGHSPTLISQNPYEDRRPRIWNDRIVWEGFDGYDFEVYFWDGSDYVAGKTNDLITITAISQPVDQGSNFHDDVKPEIQDGRVVWMSYVNDSDAEIMHWYGDKITQLTDNEIEDRNPKTANGSVVWHALNYEQSEIWLATPE